MLQKDNSGSLVDDSSLRFPGPTRLTETSLSLNRGESLVHHPHWNRDLVSQLSCKCLGVFGGGGGGSGKTEGQTDNHLKGLKIVYQRGKGG
jgi:hypothetical protein